MMRREESYPTWERPWGNKSLAERRQEMLNWKDRKTSTFWTERGIQLMKECAQNADSARRRSSNMVINRDSRKKYLLDEMNAHLGFYRVQNNLSKPITLQDIQRTAKRVIKIGVNMGLNSVTGGMYGGVRGGVKTVKGVKNGDLKTTALGLGMMTGIMDDDIGDALEGPDDHSGDIEIDTNSKLEDLIVQQHLPEYLSDHSTPPVEATMRDRVFDRSWDGNGFIRNESTEHTVHWKAYGNTRHEPEEGNLAPTKGNKISTTPPRLDVDFIEVNGHIYKVGGKVPARLREVTIKNDGTIVGALCEVDRFDQDCSENPGLLQEIGYGKPKIFIYDPEKYHQTHPSSSSSSSYSFPSKKR